jgi:hypothetical protein
MQNTGEKGRVIDSGDQEAPEKYCLKEALQAFG